MKRFAYGVHIMWYELGMIEEHFASLAHAMQQATWPIDIHICVNEQTYIETPNRPMIEVMTELYGKLTQALAEVPARKDSVFIYRKTMYDPFYNIADFRRETRCLPPYEVPGMEELDGGGYTIWGEIDAILPETYFACIEAFDKQVDSPCVLTFASRKMWDATWTPVEHIALQSIPRNQIEPPFDNEHYITQQQLDAFNDQYGNPTIHQQSPAKIDGCLLAIHSRVPALLPSDMHFAREDYIAQCMLDRLKIPQIHFINVLKGHNYRHPKKRIYTDSSRTDPIYLQYEKESLAAGMRFLNA